MAISVKIRAMGALLVTCLITASCGSPAVESEGRQRQEASVQPTGSYPIMTVYKSPTCGCCTEWVKHVEANGFTLDVNDVGLELGQIKADDGVPADATSCHTALIDGYVIEGHVPAELIAQLLRDRPDIKGLTVPGMPPGVPGMGADGPGHVPYEVLAINHDGTTSHFATR